MENNRNNKRIAKNTLVLYLRTIITLTVSLFTSRVVLKVLGVEDFGIYNVVGGVVAMFSVISGALSNSISRFITFELGKGNRQRLQNIFSTSIIIQVFLAVGILILGESVGLWFISNKMNIPEGRLYATQWVLHCSLLSFCINLISVPYNACIIAHEKMTAFAYISILEVTLKLIVVFLLYMSPIDKLICYAVLLAVVALLIRIIYGVYCKRRFEECHYIHVKDHGLLKEMFSFAGWNFFTNAAYLFNTQGVNILINLFFGVTVNAARAIAVQVESSVMKFINDFTVAINPQITKSYAIGDMNGVYDLVISGAKISFFLLLVMIVPIISEANYILGIWLHEVPEHTVIFVRLSLIGSAITVLGNSGYTACMATGRIRNYVIIITTIGCAVFPFTWLIFKLGFPVYYTYIVYIVVYFIIDIVRLIIMKHLIGFPIGTFIKQVFVRSLGVSLLSSIIPYYLISTMDEGIFRFICVLCFGIVGTLLSVWTIGLSKDEKAVILSKLNKR